MSTLKQIAYAEEGARPIHSTLSFKGLALVFIAFVFIAMGVKVDDVREWAELLVQMVAMAVTLVGIARRPDVEVPESIQKVISHVVG